MKTQLTKTTIVALFLAMLFSCGSSTNQDKFLGKWIPTNPMDSISKPLEIIKEGENVFLKVPYGKSFKEVPAVYDKEGKFLNINDNFKIFYLTDSNYLKINIAGKSENYRFIDEKEVKIRLDRYSAKIKADSVKRAQLRNSNPFSNYKNNDAEILERVLKKRKNL